MKPKSGKFPVALRLPSQEEISINRWADVLAEAANWLIGGGRLSEHHCPFTLGKSKLYFINTVPFHPDGQPFKVKRQLQNGMFIFTSFNSKALLRNCIRLLGEFGEDPSRFYVKM